MEISIILLLGTVLRIIGLNQSFWLDEAISAITAQKPFPFQWSSLSGDFQPPLYYLLLHFWMQIPFSSEWFLRIPSVIFGLFTIYIVYRFIQELFNKKTAVISSLLLTLSQYHVYYSQELRMYSLLCLLATLSMWLFYKKKWVFLALISILGIYTSYMYIFILVPQFSWLIYRYKRKREVWIKWISVCLITLAFFLLWLPVFIKQLETGRALTVAFPLWSSLSSLPFWRLVPQLFIKFTLGRITFDNRLFYGVLSAILLIFYGWILWGLRKKIDDKILFVSNWLLTPLAAVILVSFFIPVAGVWRLLFLLPPFLILVSSAISAFKHKGFVLSLVIIISIMSNILYYLMPSLQRENWRAMTGFVEKDDSPLVFTVENGFAPYQWYKSKDRTVCGSGTLDKCLISDRIYYVGYLRDLFDKNKTVENKIKERGYRIAKITDFPGVGFVYSYENSH